MPLRPFVGSQRAKLLLGLKIAEVDKFEGARSPAFVAIENIEQRRSFHAPRAA